jgi:hypothetical protein
MLHLLAGLVILAQLNQTPGEMVAKAGRVGIEVKKISGSIVVQAVSNGSSAETVGLKVGDQVLRIDIENTSSSSQSDASAALRGVFNSGVTLTVLPRGSMMPRTVDVKRDVRLYDVGNQATIDTNDFARKPPESETQARKVIAAQLLDLKKTGGTVPEDALREPFTRASADVATCVGALDELLPADLATLGATFTSRHDGTISVKTDPPSGDLASCLGRRSTSWKIPKPGKDPTVVEVHWTITRP